MQRLHVSAICAVALLTAASRAQEVSVRVAGDQLRIAAPSFRFLTGKPLDSLRNGVTVTYDVHVSVLSQDRQFVLRRALERFAVSYDLWEERFSVSRMRSSDAPATRLTAQAVEAWCLDRFSLPTAGLPDGRSLIVRVDVQARNGRDTAPIEEDGLSIGALIELFSRSGRAPGVSQWRAESPPFTLASLSRSQSK